MKCPIAQWHHLVKDLGVWILVISHNVKGSKLMANSYRINLNANPVYKHIKCCSSYSSILSLSIN